MLGYFEDRQATEDAFNAGGWFMTGDLGSIDEGGYLRIAGRAKDIIIRGGHNIHPARIEELATRHAAVQREAAVPVKDARLGEKVCLAVVFRAGKVIQLTGTIGYYSLLAMTVNTCELEAGPGAEVLPS